MGEELGWSSAEQRAQLERARQFIDLEMGQLAKQNAASNVSLNLTKSFISLFYFLVSSTF
ncbi:unnamed protein product [Strongylus vulgaris]|uniref:Uncharacterized protein n=1 Tax=Strongylus vulgaris TaxID=40348 RepID=A0A3P7JJP4_STRVU|nr:unnamed protein product [Strongylus vulgaris]